MRKKVSSGFDKPLLFGIGLLIGFSLIMVTSASLLIAEQHYGNPLYFTLRHGAYLTLGVLIATYVVRLPMNLWQRYSQPILVIALLLLMLVLVPGIGRQINGSTRWIGAGPLTLQVSELAKIAVILYFSGYIVRRQEELSQTFLGFFKPLLVLAVIGFLLLLEPDFGAAVVIGATTMGLLFLGGVSLRAFLTLCVLTGVAAAILAISSPYRVLRLTSFLNPWADQFNTGYQLTQALIAFGRGEWTGLGLGNSIQKLLYLPEAHTDFLLAVIGEELGFLGLMVVVGIYVFVVARILWIGKRALQAGEKFSGLVAHGVALWLGLQTFVNVGVNMGILPTKGLTLPFLSYGGSSVVAVFVMIGIVLRIDHETRERWMPSTHTKMKWRPAQ